MTDLEDHAKRGGGPEVVLTADLPQRPPMKILSATMIDANELTDEDQFPQHGKFLKMEPMAETDSQADVEYWECPGSMAGAVMEVADEEETEPEGAILDVTQVSKTPSGEWRFVLSLSEEP